MKGQNISKTTFVATHESDVDRVLMTCHSLSHGFYTRKGFVILPQKYNSSGVVILPPLPYHNIARFWNILQNASFIPQQLTPVVPQKLRNELASYLSYSPASTLRIQKQWSKIAAKFWNMIHDLFPWSPITSLEIRISPWGTIASWASLEPLKKEQPLLIYIRSDASAAHIAEVILSALIEIDASKLALSWEEREAIVDYLLTKTPFHKLFPNYSPTILGIHTNTDALKRTSAKYIESLGIHTKKSFEKISGHIYCNNQRVDHFLSVSQMKLLSILIEHENSTTDYDDLARVLWDDDERFSLWAINKHMQRLSGKLKTLIGVDLIEPVRGRGYILINSRVI